MYFMGMKNTKRNREMEKVIVANGVDERLLVPIDVVMQVERNKRAILALVDGLHNDAYDIVLGRNDEDIFDD